MATPLVWDEDLQRRYQLGVDHVALYPLNPSTKKYDTGVAWSGVTKITESPDGAEIQKFYADNIVYGSTVSTETLGGTIEAYDYPDEFAACDGSATLAPGVTIGQQPRQKFGLSYRVKTGDAVDSSLSSFILVLIYGATAKPSSRENSSINDSPEFMSMAWDFDTVPVPVKDHSAVSLIRLDSRVVPPAAMKAITDALYGTGAKAAYLPLPDELATLAKTNPSG